MGLSPIAHGDGELVRTAVMGIGRWGQNLVRVLSNLDRARLVCVVDPDPEARSAAGAIAPDAARLRHIDEVGPDVRAIVCCTPALDHAAHVREILAHRRNVLVEKPFALGTADALDLAAAAKSAGVVLMVGHQLLFHPAFELLRRLVAEGRIGRLREIRTVRTGPVDFNREPGVIWSYGPHDVAMALSLTGGEPVLLEAAGRLGRQDGGVEAVETADIRLAFGSGVQAAIHLSAASNDCIRRFTAVGDEGVLVFDDSNRAGRLLAGTADTDAALESIPVAFQEPLALECAHFLEAIALRSEPRTGAAHAVSVTRLLERASAAVSPSS